MSVNSFLDGLKFGQDNYFDNEKKAQSLTELRLGQQVMNQEFSDNLFLKPSELMEKLSLNKYKKSLYDYGDKKYQLDLDVLNRSGNDLVNAGVATNRKKALESLSDLDVLRQTRQDLERKKILDAQTGVINSRSAQNTAIVDLMKKDKTRQYFQDNPSAIEQLTKNQIGTELDTSETGRITAGNTLEEAQADQDEKVIDNLLAQGNKFEDVESYIINNGSPSEQIAFLRVKRKRAEEEEKKAKEIVATQKTSQAYLLNVDPYRLAKQEGIPTVDANGNPIPKETLQNLLADHLQLWDFLAKPLEQEKIKSQIYKNYHSNSDAFYNNGGSQ